MRRTLFPMTDSGLLAWSLNLSAKLSSSPALYNCTAAIASSYAVVHEAFAEALLACDPNDRSRTLVARKNAAREQLKQHARRVVSQVKAGEQVTTAQKMELGINPRAAASPIPAPAVAPILVIETVNAWTVTLKLRDATHSAPRGRPKGVAGASIFYHVGPNPPTALNEWTFKGNFGRTKLDLTFDSTLAPGTRVWLTAFWFNGRKQHGPACSPVNTHLQGGSVQSVNLLALGA